MSHLQTSPEARDLFFSTAIPLGGRVTSACLSAGDALLKCARMHGVQTRLFRREESYFGPGACQGMRALNASIIAKLDTLPPSPQRQSAIVALRKYSEALSC